jgi:hypothetical protein
MALPISILSIVLMFVFSFFLANGRMVFFFFLRSNSLIFYEGSKPNDNSSLYQEFLNYFLHQLVFGKLA